MKKFFTLFLFLLHTSFLLQAQTTTWTGGAGTSAWTDVLNWDNGIPTATHHVIIAPTGIQPNLSTTTNIQNLTIQSTASLTLSSLASLTISNNCTNQGTLSILASANSISVGNNFDNSSTCIIEAGKVLNLAGNFNNTGTFSPDPTSFVNLNGTTNTNFSGTCTFANLTISKSGAGQASINQLVTVSSNLLINGGATLNINGGQTLQVAGNITNSGTFTHNANSILELINTNTQNLVGVLNLQMLQISKPSGIVNVGIAGGACIFTHANTLTVPTNVNLIADNTASSLNLPQSLIVNGSFSVNTGITATFSGTNNATISGTGTVNFAHLTLTKTGANNDLLLARNITINGNLTINVGAELILQASQTLQIGGNLMFSGTFTPQASCVIELIGTASQDLTGTIGTLLTPLPTLAITKTAGTINIGTGGASLLMSLANTLTVPNGVNAVLNNNNTDLNLFADFVMNGSLTENNNPEVFFVGTAHAVLSGTGVGCTFHDLIVGKTGGATVTMSRTCTITDDLTINANNTLLITAVGTISLSDDLNQNGTLSASAGNTFNFVGGGTSVLSGTGSTTFRNLTISKGADLAIDKIITVQGNYSNTTTAGTTTFSASPIFNGAFDHAGAGNATFNAVATLANDYNHSGAGIVTFNSTPTITTQNLNHTGTGNTVLACNLNINNINISNGNVFLNNTFALEIVGNLTATSGTYTANPTSTTRFTGAGTNMISGVGAVNIDQIVLNKTTGTVQVDNTSTTITGNLTVPANITLIGNTNSNIQLGGSFTNNGTFTPVNPSTVTLVGTTAFTFTPTTNNYHNLVINKIGAGNATVNQNINLNGSLTIEAGNLNISSGQRIDIAENFTHNGGNFLPASATSEVRLNGTGTHIIGGTQASLFQLLTLNKTSGQLTIAQNPATVQQNFTLPTGVTLRINGGQNLALQRDFAYEGTIDTNDGGLIFNGASNSNVTRSAGQMLFRDLINQKTAGFKTTLQNNTLVGSWLLNNSGELELNSAITLTIGTIYFGGAFWQNNATFTCNNATVEIQGTAGYNIQGTTAISIYNLVMNATGGSANLQRQVDVTNQLRLTNGIINTTAANVLRLTNTASLHPTDAGSNTSHVAGSMRKDGTTNFIFPVGKGGRLGRLGITSLSGAGEFTAEYFDQIFGNSSINFAQATPLVNVSDKEYWRLIQTGTVSASVTLYWNDNGTNTTSGINTLADANITNLQVARWNTTIDKWENAGGTAHTGAGSQATQGNFSCTPALTPLAVDDFLSIGIRTVNNLDWGLITWVGDIDANWFEVNNWSPRTIPDYNITDNRYYNVRIPDDKVNYPIIQAVQIVDIGSLTLPQNIDPTPPTPPIISTVQNNGTLNIGINAGNGTLDISGTFTNNATLTTTGATRINDSGLFSHTSGTAILGTLAGDVTVGTTGTTAGISEFRVTGGIVHLGKPNTPNITNRSLITQKVNSLISISGASTVLNVRNNLTLAANTSLTNGAGATINVGAGTNSTLTSSGTITNEGALAVVRDISLQNASVTNNNVTGTISATRNFALSGTSNLTNANILTVGQDLSLTGTASITNNTTISIIRDFTLANGTIVRNNGNIRVTRNFNNNNTTAGVHNLTGTGSMEFIGGGNSAMQNGTGAFFNHQLIISKNTGTTLTMSRSSTCTNAVTVPTGVTFTIANNLNPVFVGNLTVNGTWNTGNSNATSTVTLESDLVNNGTLNATGRITFGGATNGQLLGSVATTTLNNVVVNKTAGAAFTIDRNLNVSGSFTHTAGTTNLNGTRTLAITGTLDNNGGIINTLANSTLNLTGNLNNSVSTFNAEANSTLNLASNLNNNTNGTFNALANALINLTGNFNNNANATFNIGANAEVALQSNFTNDGIFTAENNSTFRFQGGNTSIGGTADITFGNLILNKTAGTSLTLNRQASLSNALTLTQGYINTTTTNLLILQSNATATAGSPTSFVNGAMRKFAGSADFVFPVGKVALGRWARIGLKDMTDVDNTDHFTAEYFDGFNNSCGVINNGIQNTVGILKEASTYEHWILDKGTTGTTKARVTLYWENGTFSRIDNLGADLMIARCNGVAWEGKLKTLEAGSTVASGAITTTDLQTNFSPWTFGSQSFLGSNPLPITLLDFVGKEVSAQIHLEWTTLHEQNFKHFEIERSHDSQNFIPIGISESKGSINLPTKYGWIDTQPREGMNYYRLRMVEDNQAFSFSPVVAVWVGKDNALEKVLIYPNPLTSPEKLHIILPTQADYGLTLTDLQGREVGKWQIQQEAKTSLSLETLPTGMYLLRITNGKDTIIRKIVKQ